MDFHNFYPIQAYVFKDTADIPTELLCLSDLENPSQLPVRRYWWYCLINCWHFQTIHVFEVRESIANIPTELACLSYLKNLRQLPVRMYLTGTDNCILWIFTISSLFMFSRSRNSLLTFLMSYDVGAISMMQVNFRFERYWWFCLMNFWNFHTIRVFEVSDSIADISKELPCSGNLENPDKLPVQDLLGGTGECVLQIFEISSPFMFLR